jgi:tetratricopeptide (TPR) repeat protein
LRRQVDSGYRGADYDFIRATCPGEDNIEFALDTKRARTEVRAQSTQGKLLRELVARASTASSRDTQLGRTLFQLLVPTEVEPFLAGTGRVLLELDDKTAVIPWELLDTRGDDPSRSEDRPWAIRAQLLRKLRQEHYRQQVQDAHIDDAVLVIGEPQVDAAIYPPLPGARAEAEAVVKALGGAGGLGAQRVNALIDGNDATSIINALFERRYRIVHVAGHGEPVRQDDKGQLLSKGGVVLSDDTFLGSDEIKSMRTVPELVFVNCCHLAARDSQQALRTINRAEFAWGVADSLIEIGVRCVIAAGWAVDDAPAKVFATTFYREILDHKPFITAVAIAREAAWLEDKASNTWAAYQCYGDPNWSYRRSAADAAATPIAPREEYEGIASALALTLALEEVAVKSKWMRADPAEQLEKVRHLEARFSALWGEIGAVAEAFGVAYAEAGDRDAAIAWYERALRCNDASASLKTHEQLGNLLARRGWERADRATDKAALPAAREDIARALRDLQTLTGLQPTMERHCLCGSAWKRLALLERKSGSLAAHKAALKMATESYLSAERLAAAEQSPELYYPALNRMALELVVHVGQRGWAGLDAEASDAVRRSLQAKSHTAPDFWCYAGQVELESYDGIASSTLAARLGALQEAYAELHGRVSGRQLWGTVADQAELVLTAYAAVAKGEERNAARTLLATLRGHAK